MSSTIHIDSVAPSPSGKSFLVKSGQKTYFAKTDSGLQSGTTIEAETKTSFFNGKENVWIEKWKVPTGPATQPAASTVQVQEQFTSTGINMNFLPFTSNCVAHAIAAGRIEQPGDIQKWAQAAYSAALSLKDVPY